MLVALWMRWRIHGRIRWLVLAALVVVVDAVIGGALIAWEVGVVREMVGR